MYEIKIATFLGVFIYWTISVSNAYGKNILIVGDSLTCGPFGAELSKRLSANPKNSVTLKCMNFSNPINWIEGTLPAKAVQCHTCTGNSCSEWQNSNPMDPTKMQRCDENGVATKLENILKQKKYDRVVVALGTNTIPKTIDSSYSQMINIIRKNHVDQCNWIGPPHFSPEKSQVALTKERSLASFYDGLYHAVNKQCALTDSRDFTAFPSKADTIPDGVHRTADSGKIWADDVIPKIGEQLSPPSSQPQSSQ